MLKTLNHTNLDNLEKQAGKTREKAGSSAGMAACSTS
jgi:hypothetical protein